MSHHPNKFGGHRYSGIWDIGGLIGGGLKKYIKGSGWPKKKAGKNISGMGPGQKRGDHFLRWEGL